MNSVFKIIAFVLISSFISCRAEKKESAYPVAGDWIGINTKSGSERIAGNLFLFSFGDSVASSFSAWGDFNKYVVKDDTIKMRDPGDFIILNNTTDSLILKANFPTTDSIDIIRLSRVKQKNTLKPDRIIFISSGCFGTCPSMVLEIDSSRTVRLLSIHHMPVQGGFSGKIDETIYQELLLRIRNLPLDSLQEHYEAHWTDDQSCGVIIQSGDTVVYSSAYGFNEEPVELRLLFHYMMELYKRIDVQQDSKISEEYYYHDSLFRKLDRLVRPRP